MRAAAVIEVPLGGGLTAKVKPLFQPEPGHLAVTHTKNAEAVVTMFPYTVTHVTSGLVVVLARTMPAAKAFVRAALTLGLDWSPKNPRVTRDHLQHLVGEKVMFIADAEREVPL